MIRGVRRGLDRLSRLRRDTSGLAMLEFGLAMPIVLTLGMYGIEYSNLALINLKISQITLNLADNASRVGVTGNLSTQQLREVDMNDVLQAARYQGTAIKLSSNARVTISSLENTSGTQRIHWQRCLGVKGGAGYDSSYGTTLTTDGTDSTPGTAGTAAPGGMGDAGSTVNAPAGSGVMFVEMNYYYTPIVGSWLSSPQKLHYIASFIVRDHRDFTQIYNPAPASTRSTCNLHGV